MEIAVDRDATAKQLARACGTRNFIWTGIVINADLLLLVAHELHHAGEIHRRYGFDSGRFQDQGRFESNAARPATCFESEEDDDTLCSSSAEGSSEHLSQYAASKL